MFGIWFAFVNRIIIDAKVIAILLPLLYIQIYVKTEGRPERVSPKVERCFGKKRTKTAPHQSQVDAAETNLLWKTFTLNIKNVAISFGSFIGRNSRRSN